jgi:protein-disulfide isomerase
MRKILTAVAAVAIAAAVLAGVQTRAATTGAFDDAQEKAIQEIVRSYLLANPELLEEVIGELQKRREAEAAVARQEYLRELYKPDSKYGRYGMSDGDVVIVEFMDYNCPYCRKAYATLRELSEKGGIEVRFVEFPVLGPASILASQAAIAAEKQGKYVEFHDAMMGLNERIESEDTIFNVAKKVGLDIEQLKKDMEAPETEALIQENLQLGEKLGVQGTPAIFVGDTFIPGAPENLKEELEEAITDTRASCTVC